MSTLLLVGGEAATEQAPGSDRPGPRRGPTMKRALERVGYEVV
jgi:hypothetical protein